MESIGDGTKMGIAKAAAAGQRKAEWGSVSELATLGIAGGASASHVFLMNIPNVDLSL